MTIQQDRAPSLGAGWLVPAVAIVALVLATAALTLTLAGGWMTGRGGMMANGAGMMGSNVPSLNGPQPGDQGFVAGTVAAPRQIRIVAGPGYAFSPPSIKVARGETVTFVVTTMGPAVHELMVGPADAVAADREGTPEVADIGMMQSKSLTYTFDGPGPFAFACHEAGHYEAGMRGAIVVIG